MAESTLALTRSDLLREVGIFLGWPHSSTDWSSIQATVGNTIVSSGLRNFYFPASGYDWSFMHPVASLTLPDDDYDIDLPDDFGGAEGNITYSGSSTSLGMAIPFVNEGAIREKRSLSNETTGKPCIAAVRPKKGVSPDEGQRFELLVWPTPDQDYDVRISYYLVPEALTDGAPHHYGGAVHSETILESCLAVAETRLGSDVTTNHRGLFQERLKASMDYDRKLKPAMIGHGPRISRHNTMGEVLMRNGVNIFE